MCLVSQPSTPQLQEPTQFAAQRAPDGEEVRSSTSRRTLDKMRSSSPTVLTSGSGVTAAADTSKKTLLGA